MHTSRSPASAPPSSSMAPPLSGVAPPLSGDALDLSVSGSRLTMSRRPSSASPGKTFCRSVSVIAESRHRHRNALSDVLGGSRSIKNLRRSNSTTQVNHINSLSPEPQDEYLTLFSADAHRKLSKDATTWNILDDQPRAAVQLSPASCSSPASQGGPKKREGVASLAATFNNRSNKGAVGNSVTTILHNNHNSDKPLTPKSSNFNNLLKANDDVIADAASVTKSQKNFTSCNPAPSPLSTAPLRRQEVTEAEAERFIEQVNQAALTIQRWFRLQRQRRTQQDQDQDRDRVHSWDQDQDQDQRQDQGQSELQQLLSSTRQAWEERRSAAHRDEDRRRIREEKARVARLHAVQELQQRRAQRSLEPDFNSAHSDAPRSSTRGKRNKTGLQTGLQTGVQTGVQTGLQTRVQGVPRPVSLGDKNNMSTEPQLNIDFSDLTFRAVSPAPSNHRESPCPQASCADLEPVRLSSGGRKKPPKTSAPNKSPSAAATSTITAVTTSTVTATATANRSPAPLSPGLNKHSNTEPQLNIDFSDLTFRAVSPAPSNHRESPCPQGAQEQRSTLIELLDSLRLLEEEPCKLLPNDNYCKDKYCIQAGHSALTADNLQRLVLQSRPPPEGGALPPPEGGALPPPEGGALPPPEGGALPPPEGGALPPPEGGALLSEAKLRSIMSFLDEMERSSASGSHKEAPPSEDELAAAAELSGTLTRTRLELDERTRTVHLLQGALAQQRELTLRHVKETETELNRNFQLQKEQYEATIQRHLAFIDQLISDKKALSERCEGVVSELKLVDHKYTQKIQQMQEQHDMEIKKLKELMAASEKNRREKWIDEKTRKIKEITVKGLEPEIQRLISKHKQELNKLRSLHEAELLQADERAAQRFTQQSEELRERLQRERHEDCERERESAKHRQRVELEELRAQMEENSSVAGRALRQELEKTREEQEKRHQMELKSLQEQMQQERQSWEDTCRSQQEAWLRTRERELREELKKQRDKEIHLVICSLEEQTSHEREEHQRHADTRVRRVREKLEAELQEAERSEKAAVEKHQETRQKLLRVEEELMKSRSELRLKDHALEQLTQSVERLGAERGRVEEVIRGEFAERLLQVEEENTALKNTVSELRARLHLELQRVTMEKEAELQQVHQRVKAAILKKEESVNSLRKQHEAALKRADHLEALWEQQRKQLLQK